MRSRFLPRFVATGSERCARALAAVTAAGGGVPATVRGELHTLAGEAGILGFGDLAELAQSGERDSLAWAEAGDVAARARCAIAIRTLAARIRRLTPVEEPRRRLLVVDDSALVAAEIGAELRAIGWEVEAAADVESAERRLGEFRPQIVLLDVNLPGRSLADSCARTRAAATGPIAICLLSGATDAELAERAAQVGADAWVSKIGGISGVVDTVRAMAAKS